MALPFSTIQDGLDVADGETIIVLQDGAYSGAGNINLEIYDSYTRIESSNGYSNTIMDCENSGFGIALNKGTFFLTGLAIQNCNGILRELDGLPLGNGTGAASIKNRTIGGGLWIENAYAKITNCKLDSNTAELGGGMYTFSRFVWLSTEYITCYGLFVVWIDTSRSAIGTETVAVMDSSIKDCGSSPKSAQG